MSGSKCCLLAQQAPLIQGATIAYGANHAMRSRCTRLSGQPLEIRVSDPASVDAGGRPYNEHIAPRASAILSGIEAELSRLATRSALPFKTYRRCYEIELAE